MEVRCQVYVPAALLSSCKPHISIVQGCQVRPVADLLSWSLAHPICIHVVRSYMRVFYIADRLSYGLHWKIEVRFAAGVHKILFTIYPNWIRAPLNFRSWRYRRLCYIRKMCVCVCVCVKPNTLPPCNAKD